MQIVRASNRQITLHNPAQRAIDQLTERFIEEIQQTVREVALEAVNKVLGSSTPLPRLTEGKSDLTPAQKKAFAQIKQAKSQVTSKTVAKALGSSESNARQVLSKLLRKRLVTAKALGDGTARKVYLPAKP